LQLCGTFSFVAKVILISRLEKDGRPAICFAAVMAA
jgi:hypothetical protein